MQCLFFIAVPGCSGGPQPPGAHDTGIVVLQPTPGQEITNPVRISGKARGLWFFEGQFPVSLRDQNGHAVARSYAKAKEEWTRPELVAFEAELEFPADSNGEAQLVFERIHQGTGAVVQSFEVPVRLKRFR
ncbi:MAG: Gmad2 immunoglobulin-like domain-containing protein [Acidobacteria bacterium]|nr:Gmad2 immunoglobulin-like domain-containing protein [Acidobacteriota bacterium]